MFFRDLISSTNIVTWALAGLLIISMAIQLIYYLGVFGKIIRYKSLNLKKHMEAISIVICARNEAENLEKHLPAFLTQDYKDYEVVVVNDCSTDNTEDVLMDMKVKYPHLRSTSIPLDRKFTHGKKLAMTVGIKSAQNDCILFSDADCYPVSDKWISLMSRNFTEKKNLILGIGLYERKRGVLNAMVRYETLFTAMQYISYAISGKAYMGVGRNLAYTKDLFFNNKGFASHLKVLSGDDDLFVNEATTKTNTTVCIDPNSFTRSVPPLEFKSWIRQKRRHISTGKHYSGTSKRRLAGEYLSRILFYLVFTALLFDDRWRWISLGAYTILSTVKLIHVKMTMRRLNERDILLPSLLFDPLMPWILGIISVVNLFSRREPKWN
jgi:poly-beta-1,6-N-acetyl-D-glucosamine synthase